MYLLSTWLTSNLIFLFGFSLSSLSLNSYPLLHFPNPNNENDVDFVDLFLDDPFVVGSVFWLLLLLVVVVVEEEEVVEFLLWPSLVGF